MSHQDPRKRLFMHGTAAKTNNHPMHVEHDGAGSRPVMEAHVLVIRSNAARLDGAGESRKVGNPSFLRAISR